MSEIFRDVDWLKREPHTLMIEARSEDAEGDVVELVWENIVDIYGAMLYIKNNPEIFRGECFNSTMDKIEFLYTYCPCKNEY